MLALYLFSLARQLVSGQIFLHSPLLPAQSLGFPRQAYVENYKILPLSKTHLLSTESIILSSAW